MTRKRKHSQSLAQYKVQKDDDREEAERLRALLYEQLTRYAEKLGKLELLRRLRIDYLDPSLERVERLDGGDVLTEDHPIILDLDAQIAALEAEEQQKSPRHP